MTDLDRLLARMAGRYEVRAAREEDLDDVARLFRETWDSDDDAECLKRRFRYRYWENPNSGAGEGLWLCRTRKGTLVGFSAMVDTVVWEKGRAVPAAYCADAVVVPAHRGFGVPHLLQQRMNDRRELVLEGNVNEDARRFAEQSGARTVAGCSVFRRWARPSDLVRASARLEKVDERFDQLWKRAREAYPLVALRDAATLSWRFGRNPHEGFEIHATAEGDTLVGYAVTKLKPFRGPFRRGLLVDFLFAPTTPPERMRDFFGAVLGSLARRGAVVTDAVATHPPERGVLEDLSFHSKHHDPGYMVYETPATRERRHLWASESWHFTFADSDLHL